MPCWRCGAREVDPARGPSPWKRGVREGAHVLVCPDCQRDRDWLADLDHCPTCGSWRLARQLGVVTCRQCGAISPTAATSPDDEEPAPREQLASSGQSAQLAADVHAALERLWGRADGAADR